MVLTARAVLFAFLAVAVVAGKPYCRLRKRGQFVVQPPHPTSPATPTSTTSHAPTPSATGGAGSDDEDELPPFDYEKNVIRGVNLGGWFVLEPWITPSIFEQTGNDAIIDEYTFGQLQPRDVALAALTKHWESWYTEDEFKLISDAGLNHVRVPIGYWAVPLNQSVEPYVPGAYPYFKTALKWARKYGLHVIVDLHGAKGSQNGYDNSGQKRNDPQWANDPDNLQHTVDVISFLSNDVGPSISIVQLLNEIAAYTSQRFQDATRQYWMDGYHAIRAAKAAGDRVQVMIGDGFQGLNAWQGFMQPPEYKGVSMDYHMYQVFSIRELSRNYDEHVAYACSLGPGLADFTKNTMPAVVGEWSLAITDCTKWLNGRGVGVRWDGTYYPTADTVTLGSCEYLSMDYTKFDAAYKTFLRRYWEAQVHIGEGAGGWIFWTWKAEFSAEWSYKVGVEQGWIPQDPTDRQYPDICG